MQELVVPLITEEKRGSIESWGGGCEVGRNGPARLWRKEWWGNLRSCHERRIRGQKGGKCLDSEIDRQGESWRRRDRSGGGRRKKLERHLRCRYYKNRSKGEGKERREIDRFFSVNVV